MDVFEVHAAVMKNYRSFIESFINIDDEAIRAKVASELSSGKLWPDPLIQFNPSFEEYSYIGVHVFFPFIGAHHECSWL